MGKMLKHVNSRIYEHISSQLYYRDFRIDISHLSTQEVGLKNGII